MVHSKQRQSLTLYYIQEEARSHSTYDINPTNTMSAHAQQQTLTIPEDTSDFWSFATSSQGKILIGNKSCMAKGNCM